MEITEQEMFELITKSYSSRHLSAKLLAENINKLVQEKLRRYTVNVEKLLERACNDLHWLRIQAVKLAKPLS